jgi:hypothetical protein
VFFATDVANFLACRHLLTLDRAEARGEIAKPVYYDSGAELLRELGIRHEQAFLRHLIDTERLEVVEIPTVDISWTDAVARTVDAVRQGADAIYQATFQDGPWGGRSDFLVRVDKAYQHPRAILLRGRRNEACPVREGAGNSLARSKPVPGLAIPPRPLASDNRRRTFAPKTQA